MKNPDFGNSCCFARGNKIRCSMRGPFREGPLRRHGSRSQAYELEVTLFLFAGCYRVQISMANSEFWRLLFQGKLT